MREFCELSILTMREDVLLQAITRPFDYFHYRGYNRRTTLCPTKMSRRCCEGLHDLARSELPMVGFPISR